jgi:FAD/FMN-containing dehydrogenase/Fe-S oxidoreductase
MTSLASLQAELHRVIDGDVRFDAGTLAVYSTDASNYRQVPIGVVRPRHSEDVIRAVALARENGVPLLARGGGTSLAGQTCNTALVIDFSKYMTAVRAVDPERKLAVVEPGVIQSLLNAELGQCGLFFPPDPATKDRCTLGGMIGNNSCGAHSAAYGKTVDNVIGLDFLLYDGTRLDLQPKSAAEIAAIVAADGRTGELYAGAQALANRYAEQVRNHYPRIPRRVSGYNLDELLPERGFNLARALVGSEGTLGLVLGATVKVVPKPEELVLVALGFADIFIAADQVPWILEHRPEALEAFDDKLVEFGRTKGLASVRLLPRGGGFLIAELGGATRDEARERGEALVRQAKQAKDCTGSVLLVVPTERDAVWRLRESGLASGAPRPGRPRTWPGAEDCAVSPIKLGQFLRQFDALLTRHRLEAGMYYGHFGQGCVHCRIDFDLASSEGVSTFRTAMVEIGQLVGKFGGSISGEHGDGIARSELLPSIFGPELIGAFREFKRLLDPEGRMNPGVIVDPLPLDSKLRLGSKYHPAQVGTIFNFESDGGLAGAALRCVGVGKCRKVDAGTMCPSYMVTREELYSTRGRARLLFEALTNDDVLKGGLNDHALYDALQYCLSCKSCKTECPAAVDMALYKAEFLAHYHRHYPRPWRARLFGRMNEWAALASRTPRLANAVAASFLGSWLKRAAGIHPSRPLPRFAPQTFRQWFARRPPHQATAGLGGNPARSANHASGAEVVLFSDCFTNYFEPDVAVAAVQVLERAGFRVVLPAEQVCCGRPLYDQGMLDLAKERLRNVMRVLGPHLERGTRVVGLEPGCILTFRDELPRLFPSGARAELLAQNSLLLDEFLQREAPGFVPPPYATRALVHGHCHHKAIAGIENEVSLLGKVPGLELQVLDAGCCGLAGAFGYEQDKFEMSRALAERVLLPAIRAGGPDPLVISDGFSCRSQIRCFAPMARAVHLAQVLNGISPPHLP